MQGNTENTTFITIKNWIGTASYTGVTHHNYMKYLLLIFTLLPSFLFGQGNDDILSFNEIDKIEFDNVNFNNIPSIQTNIIKKENGKIRIPNKHRSGSFTEFVDDTRIEENKVDNIYHGFYKHLKRHLIETNYYEGSKFTLIGQYKNQTEIWSLPIFSTDNKYFFTFKPYGLEGEPVGLQIWEVDTSGYKYTNRVELKMIFELNQLIFSPEELKWDKDNSILIKGQPIENHFLPNNNSDIKYWRLKFE